MASAAVSLPPGLAQHDTPYDAHPLSHSVQSSGDVPSTSQTSSIQHSSTSSPHTSFQSDDLPPPGLHPHWYPQPDRGSLHLGGASANTKESRMKASGTAPGALDRVSRQETQPKRTQTKLEDFELIHVLGKGCAGRVLLVRHTPTSSIRAMKALSKRSVLTHDELHHTMTELSILRRFSVMEPSNPFVSTLQCSFTDRENIYFVMDFYPGGDLATQMEIHGLLGHHRTRFYAADLTQGLEDLHRNGIIVRDLKPENILLNARGHAVLADFGLSKEFDYRGEPLPLHVVTYPGEPDPPEWAGAGMGSARIMKDGSRRLVVDRAMSFVGTSDYLSPEVVRRAEYTYAVDWWALGCIVLEGLVGRVPFHAEEDEPLSMLWNRILLDPWEDALREPRIACRPLTEYGLDEVTWSFIDALLIKDPMWRLTEPCIKNHAYFQHIDWDTVKAGEYDDPHDLELHPVSEYNTRYFPKLCLEEEPSVDMKTHDERYADDDKIATPLNDNSLYALECARYRKELESFTWSREDEMLYTSEQHVDLAPWPPHHEGMAESEEEGSGSEALSSDASTTEHESEDEPRRWSPADIDLPLPLDEDETLIPAEIGDDQAIEYAGHDGSEEMQEQEASTPMSVVEVDAPGTARPGPEAEPVVEIDADPRMESPIPMDEGHSPTPNTASAAPFATLTRTITGSPKQKPIPIRPVKNQLRLGLNASGSSTLLARRTSQDNFASVPSPNSRPSRQLRLPSGLPHSGLSVSDIVSIPSPGLGSPTHIIRRHPQLPSVDDGPIARLSVDLHGTVTQLGDEDWEELQADSGTQSADNVPPSSFLSRVLRRRPSTIQASTLSRQVRSSNSSASSSPTKTRGLSAARLGHADGMTGSTPGSKFGTTKKALEKIKAFPKFRKVSDGTSSPAKAEIIQTPPKRHGVRQRLDSRLAMHSGPLKMEGGTPSLLDLKAAPIHQSASIAPTLALPPSISPLSESFSVNRPLSRARVSDQDLKVLGSDVDLKSPVESISESSGSGLGTDAKATLRPSASRRHTESSNGASARAGGVGIGGWLDKKPRTRRKDSGVTSSGSGVGGWGKRMSASVSLSTSNSTSSPRKKSALFRSGQKNIRSSASTEGIPRTGSRSETNLDGGGKEAMPKLELKTTAPLDIQWK
ncbi:hypothetical protein BD324DRAFT_650394 [Kockovaella imperatae]|uniref:non-specific serine/threonine protein kinase n=1 Tax=Kockovaella imperatae TaxID=4999 RepID=A0A1Y1UIJ9_9TREE|nr:hypothetical protein BD324DRAFT_650394 [Kockovaella imperatae]ORX37851.1 hypothetical protein BD324DRAFT_650394 [Kockovaella imperatae]